MLLCDIFSHLNYGELSQLSLAGADEQGITSAAYPAIISHLNMGLIELYKRFPLRMREVDIKLDSTITEYSLTAPFGLNSGSSETVKYLIDTPTDNFLDRVLKIERVETDDIEVLEDLPLNDSTDTTSVYTLGFNILKVISPNDTDTLTVHYRSAPDKIVNSANIDPETLDIPIPQSLLEALVYFIAGRAHANVPSIDGNPSESITYLQKFEASVAKVEQLSLIENTNTTNERLVTNGWV